MSRSGRIASISWLGLLLVWALCLLWPSSRHQLSHDWRSSYPRPEVEMSDVTGLSADTLAALVDSGRRNRSQLEKLCLKQPNNPAIVAIYLRRCQLYSRSDEGPLMNPYWPRPTPTPPPGSAEPIAWGGPPPVPRADWERYLALARHGQTLEPNNLYFDVMGIHALMALNRDEEAEALLHRAARKNDFNAHHREEMNWLLEAKGPKRGIARDDLRPDDKLRQLWALGDGSNLLNAKYEVVEKAIIARYYGQHARALRIAADVLHIGETIRQRADFGSLSRSGIGWERVAFWPSLPPRQWAPSPPQKPKYSSPVAAFRSDSRSLAAYARAHGQLDLARESEREWVMVNNWLSGLKRYGAAQTVAYSPFDAKTLTLASLFEAPRHFILLALIPVLGLGLGATLVAWRREWESSEDALRLILIGFVFGLGVLISVNVADAVYAQSTSGLYQGSAVWFPDTSPYSFWLLWAGTTSQQSWRIWMPGMLWWPLIAVLVGLIVRRAFPLAVRAKAEPRFWFTSRAYWPHYEDGLSRFDPSPLFNLALHDFKALFVWLCMAAPVVAIYAALLALVGAYPFCGPVLLAFIIGAWIVRWWWRAWRTKQPREMRWREAVPALGLLSLGMLWAGTALWLAFWPIESPSRARFDTQWDDVMAHGEMAMARRIGKF